MSLEILGIWEHSLHDVNFCNLKALVLFASD